MDEQIGQFVKFEQLVAWQQTVGSSRVGCRECFSPRSPRKAISSDKNFKSASSPCISSPTSTSSGIVYPRSITSTCWPWRQATWLTVVDWSFKWKALLVQVEEGTARHEIKSNSGGEKVHIHSLVRVWTGLVVLGGESPAADDNLR